MRPLVIFEKQLGDGVLLEPALRAIAAKCGGKVALHGAGFLETLAELMPHVEWTPNPQSERFSEVWVFETGSRTAWKAFRTRAEVKRLRLRKQSHLRWFHRIAFSDVAVCEHKNLHNALFFLRGVNPEAAFEPPRLSCPPETWRHPDLPSGEFAAVNMTASLASKSWDVGKWQESLAALKLPIVLLGAGEVPAATEGLNLVNRTTLRQFIHALSAARLHLAIEGAGAHLAMAFQVPTIAIFSQGNAANPLNWYAPGDDARVLIEPGAKWCSNAQPLTGPADLIRHAHELLRHL